MGDYFLQRESPKHRNLILNAIFSLFLFLKGENSTPS